MKHRAPRIAPPRHEQLEQLRWYPVEPARFDLGLMNSPTMPVPTVPSPGSLQTVDIRPVDVATDAIPESGPGSKSSDRNLALNSLALMLSTAITGALGLLFWAAAGRLYPVAEVGSASAVITSAVMLSTLSNLSLGSMYERFLPISGRLAKSFIVRGYITVTAFAFVLGGGFLLVAPTDEMFTNTAEIVSFPFFVAVLAVFALQDQTSSGLGVARWAAAKNVFHAVVKFVMLLALFTTERSTSIISAWAVPAIVASVFVLRAILKTVRTDQRYSGAPDLPPKREMWAYFGSAYGITALGSLAPLLVPMIVVATLGAEQNAYFSLTWSIVSALYILISVLIGPYVAEVAAHPAQFHRLTKRFMTLVCIVAVGGAIFLAFVAPFGLGLIGQGYRDQGTIIVQLAAVTIPLSVVGSLYDGLARVRRRMRLAVIVQVVATSIIIGGSIGLSSSMGIAAVGWAYLVAEAFGAVVLIVPLTRWIRELSAGGTGGSGDDSGPTDPPGPRRPIDDRDAVSPRSDQLEHRPGGPRHGQSRHREPHFGEPQDGPRQHEEPSPRRIPVHAQHRTAP